MPKNKRLNHLLSRALGHPTTLLRGGSNPNASANKWNNKGVQLVEKQHYEEAQKGFEKALQLLESSSSSSSTSNYSKFKEGPVSTSASSESPSSRSLLLQYLNQVLSSSFAHPDWETTVYQEDSSQACFIQYRAEYEEGMDWWFQRPLRYVPPHDPQHNHRSQQCFFLLEATILYNLGRLHHQYHSTATATTGQGQLQKALSLYKRALEALMLAIPPSTTTSETTKTTTPRHHDESSSSLLALAIVMGIGHIQYSVVDHDLAIQTFAISHSMANLSFGAGSLEEAACLNCIGVLHYVMEHGDEEIAVQALTSCLQTRRRLLGNSHIDVGTVLNNLGRIYFQKGSTTNLEQAKRSYMEALSIRRSHKPNGIDVAATLFNLAQVFQQEHELDKALRLYQEFLKRARATFGEHHRDVAVVVTCIGAVLQEQGHPTKALAAFQQALSIGRIALGENHCEVAITLNKLGNLYYSMGDLKSALKTYRAGIVVETAVLEKGNPNIVVSYSNCAEIYKQRAEFNNALKCYKKVLKTQREYNYDKLEIASTLSNMGYVLHQKGDYSQALQVNQESLQLRRDVLGDDGDIHPDVAASLTHIGLVLLKLELHDVALGALHEAYRIRRQLMDREGTGDDDTDTETTTTPRTDPKDLAFLLYNIALIYHQQGAHEQALVFYQETSRVERETLGQAHRDLSITFYNIGQIYYQRGEMELALTHMRHALKIERDCFGADHITCARTLNEIGNIEFQLGNTPQVMAAYGDALRIYRRMGDGDGEAGYDSLVIYGQGLWRFELVQPCAAGAA